MPSISIVFSTFCIIFLAELPDKTALAALMLAARLPPRAVILGAGVAFAVQTMVAVAAGGLLTLLPQMPIGIASGLSFLMFAFLAFRRHRDEDKKEASALAQGKTRRAPWLASFFVIFVAEWGDLTQLATAALVAQTRRPVAVGIGAILALWTVTVLAAYGGATLGRRLNPKLLNAAGGVVFALIGIWMIITAFRGIALL